MDLHFSRTRFIPSLPSIFFIDLDLHFFLWTGFIPPLQVILYRSRFVFLVKNWIDTPFLHVSILKLEINVFFDCVAECFFFVLVLVSHVIFQTDNFGMFAKVIWDYFDWMENIRFNKWIKTLPSVLGCAQLIKVCNCVVEKENRFKTDLAFPYTQMVQAQCSILCVVINITFSTPFLHNIHIYMYYSENITMVIYI